MAAQSDDEITFIDLRSIHIQSPNEYEYWALETYKKANTTHLLAHFVMHCRTKTISFIGGLNYIHGDPQELRAGGTMTLAPESAGERQWIYLCEHQDKYPSIHLAYSIDEAISITAAIRSPSSDLATLLVESDLIQLATEYDSTQRQSGASGVAEKIEKCYHALGNWRSEQLRRRSAYCVTLDIIGYKMDNAFRNVMKGKTSHDFPPLFYYEQPAFKARLAKYLPNTTVDHSTPDLAAFSALADRALADIPAPPEK